MKDSRHVYRDLPALPDFDAAIDTEQHVRLPGDWWVVVADIVDSTQAIARGAYKEVNTVGVACIAAVANIDRSLSLPFIFGGDGATLAIPETLKESAVIALRGAQRMARESFGLQLRVGLLRVSDLEAANLWVRLAKVRLSEWVSQPVFSGRGWQAAEQRIKQGPAGGALLVQPDDGPAEASFEGFECRWHNIPSFQDHKLSLIVVACAADPAVNQATYRRVLGRIAGIFGDLSQHHPLRLDGLRLGLGPASLRPELNVRSFGQRGWARIAYFVRMWLQNLAGRWLFWRGRDTAAVHWSAYREDMIAHTDFRKFDGALRMVLDASHAEAQALEAWLAAEHARGTLVWGSHHSRQALITCLIESHERQHVHFVDGSDGGYALAARQVKAQLQAAGLGS